MFRSHINSGWLSSKKGPNGYVFKAPNPRLFGSADHYLVSESQKAGISTALADLATRRPVLALTAWFTIFLLGLIIFFYFPTDPEMGTVDLVISIFLIFVGAVVSLLYTLHRIAIRQLRAIQPILANASRTDQRITRADIRNHQAETASFEQSAIVGGLTGMLSIGFACAAVLLRNPKVPVYFDPLLIQNLSSAIMFGLMSAANVRIAWKIAEPTAEASASKRILFVPLQHPRLFVAVVVVVWIGMAVALVVALRAFLCGPWPWLC